MTGCSKLTQHLIGTLKSSNLVKTVNTHVYQPHVVTLNQLLCHQHHSSSLKKKKKNLSEKSTKFPKPTWNTMNCHQYYYGMTKERKEEKKNLPGKSTKVIGIIMTKEQELKWFSNNNEGIMPEHVHDTNAKFDLRYLRKNPIKLEPYSHTCIDLKIALEISTTTMVQLASRSSLAKKKSTLEEE
ncbi:hypothetical protein G9A89_014574 [Geosiphon pyriformis]|nr:hypothetical protein G9A89_014574 [Geosiphon pyriformis]